MTTDIRPLATELAAVAEAIHLASGFDEPWDATAFAGLLATPGVAGYLAMAGDGPVGLVLWRIAADEAEILTICALPDRRRTGIGGSLLRTTIDAARSAGAKRMYLEVAVDNAAAVGLYRHFGFARAGLRPAYYRRPNGAVDAMILARDI